MPIGGVGSLSDLPSFLLLGFGLIYRPLYPVIPTYLSESFAAAVGAKWLLRSVEGRKVSAPEWSAETP
jgi:hypothetical protein